MCVHVSSGVTGFLWGVSPWHCVSVTGNIMRDPVSNVSLYAWVSVSPNLAPVSKLPSLRVGSGSEPCDLWPGPWGSGNLRGENEMCLCPSTPRLAREWDPERRGGTENSLTLHAQTLLGGG